MDKTQLQKITESFSMEIKPKNAVDDWKILVGNYDDFFNSFNLHIWIKLPPSDFEAFLDNGDDSKVKKRLDSISEYVILKYYDHLDIRVRVKSIQIMYL